MIPPSLTAQSHTNWLAVAIIVAAVVMHCGLRVTIYNRINSLGWRRRTIKRIVKMAFVETWLTLFAAFWFTHEVLGAIIHGEAPWSALPLGWRIYGVVCLLVGSVLGALWLWWRPVFAIEHVSLKRRVQVVVPSFDEKRLLANTNACRRAIQIPGNQLLDLAIERIDLPIPRLPSSLVGYRIAQLSDIHLTGHIRPDYIAKVINHANAFDPEMTVLSGDIVDAEVCVSWLDGLFSKSRAHDGCYFVLGNHDTRVSDPDLVRQAMKSAGWTDIGGQCQRITCRETPTALLGNESPWFDRPNDSQIKAIITPHESPPPFRICVSHSPDQFDWARKNEVDLMLSGHTHGGQGRLPLAGPILSPSWHGSRWASGDFYRHPTTLHVSRGLGGVHLLRINCRPELSLITLRQ